MYCTSCGKEIKEGQLFCTYCGARQKQPQPQPEYRQEQQQPQPPKKKKKTGALVALILVVLILVVAAVGGVFGFRYYKEKQEEQLAQQQEQEEQQKQEEWQTFVQTAQDRLAAGKEQAQYYIFSDEEQKNYEELTGQIDAAVSEKEPQDQDQITDQLDDLDSFLTTLAGNNETMIQEKYQELDAVDVSDAFDMELTQIEELQQQVDSLVAEKNYTGAWDALQQWSSILDFIQNPTYDYEMAVEQYDLSDYPTVTAYVSVRDENDEFVDGLDVNAFYLNEGTTVNGPFTKKTILKATPLNDKEGLSVGLVADVSGSMYDEMDDAKDAMTRFVQMLDENEGDEAELTEFSETAYTVAPFGTDFTSISSEIQNMSADGETRLYDTLINELERVRSRENAKCVIAFTDGMNNCGYSTEDDVVETAQQYHIPVFIIGIGSQCDVNTLQWIAEQTGGAYQSISDTSGLYNVYDSIYRQEQDVYMLQYEVDEDLDAQAVYANIYLRTSDGHAGKVENFSFEPEEFFESMYNKFLIAGIDCQTKGERNLLDSGLIVTGDAATSDPDCIAYQSEAAIKTGGVGAEDANTFAVLLDHRVLNVKKSGDGYEITASADYDISKIRKYSTLKKNDLEKSYIESMLGEPDDDDQIWVEENRTVQETVTLVKDTDGRWKFNTRSTDSTVVNEVYNAFWY